MRRVSRTKVEDGWLTVAVLHFGRTVPGPQPSIEGSRAVASRVLTSIRFILFTLFNYSNLSVVSCWFALYGRRKWS